MPAKEPPLLGGLFLILGLAFGLGSLPTPLAALTLPEALESLRAEGIETVYTQRLVTKDLTVEALPMAGSPKKRLRTLLAPFGLKAKSSPGDGPWVVVMARSGTIEGCLSSDPEGQPIVGADIAIDGSAPVAWTNPAGCYRLLDIATGLRHLDISRPGYIAERFTLRVEPGGAHILDATLRIDAQILDSIFVATAPEQPPLGTLKLSTSRNGEELGGAPRSEPDLFSKLSRLPGLSGESGVSIGIRGNAADRLTVIVDGMDIVEPYHLRNLGALAGTVTPSAIDEVQIHRGSPPMIYGNRAGGVLEMVTSSAGRRFTGRLGTTLESFHGTLEGSLFRGRGRWLAAYREGRPETPKEFSQLNANPKYLDGIGKLSGALTENQDLSLQILRADDDFSFQQLEEVATDQDQFLLVGQQSRHSGLRYLATLGRRHLLELHVSNIQVNRVRASYEVNSDTFYYDPLARSYLIDDRRRTRRWSRRLDVQSSLGDKFDLRWGAESRRERTDYDYSGFDEFIFVERGGPPNFERKLNDELLGAFAQGTWRPRGDLTVEAGLRWDRSELSGHSGLAPRIALNLRQGEAVWRASWARAISAAGTHELLLADGLTTLAEPETSDYASLGFSHRRKQRSLAIEVFAQRIHDPRPRFVNYFKPISRIPELELDRILLRAEASRIYGLEARFDLHREKWQAGAAYQWSRAQDRLDGQWFARREERRHSANIWLTMKLPWRLELDLQWYGHDGAPTTAFDAQSYDNFGFRQALGRYNGQRLPEHHQLDIRLSRSQEWRGLRLTAEVGMDNIYDHRRIRGFDLFSFTRDLSDDLLPERDLGRQLRLGLEISW